MKCENCSKQAIFNFNTETKGRMCSTHKLAGMIDVKNIQCEMCSKQAYFNFKCETNGRYCSTHKMPNMIDLKSKKCKMCAKQPSFNFSGETEALYCSTHKLADMINVKQKLCLLCHKLAHFNLLGESKPLYCSSHKLANMINVISRKCLLCSKHPAFNFLGKTKALYCSSHKLVGMINVKNKKCENCLKQPVFNYNGETKASFCASHKLADMVNVISKTCEICDKIPMFNFIDQTKAKYCMTHKLDNMVDVKSKKCISGHCDTLANPKYDNYCAYCFHNLFPDHIKSRNYKNKEKAVAEFISQNFNESFIYDKVIGACSKRRPDMFIDMLTHVVIGEVNENQHNGYNTTCENKRLMELYQDIAHRPMIVIRFNPDGYTDANGKKIPSCWTNTKNGISLSKKNKNEWSNRLEKLKETMTHWMNNIPDKAVQIVDLFYSENE